MIRITALMDNEASANKALLHQHGLSFLVERDGDNTRILFDCGQGEAVCQNARRLGRDLAALDGVVLSHSHYDHAAGYRDLLEQGMGSRILYTGPRFFEPKYARKGLCFSDLSAGFDEGFLKKCQVEHRVCEGKRKLAEGMWLVGDFPRKWEFEKIPERFVRWTKEGMVSDDFGDEICLALELKEGLAVLAGCSHPGILNMVEHVKEIFGRPVHALFGGTHLKEADEERIRLTVEHLKAAGVRILGMNHCSGRLAKEWIDKDLQVQSCCMAVGDCVFLE